ncbi:MAG: D-alanyl-D-alanine carboxypeptidase family protein, partial [Notoacmeibacter sp.]
KTVHRAFLACALAACPLGSMDAAAQTTSVYEAPAKTVLLVDENTSSILFAKEPDATIPPASLAKLMTAELVFKGLSDGSLTLNQTFKVSENAWRTGGAPSGGAAMFAVLKSDIAISDLLRGLIVQAGNDAAIVLAEGVAGSEAKFVEIMNARAAELGLSSTKFANSTGLPEPKAQVTLRDLVKLVRHIQKTYPAYVGIFAEPEFLWNKINQRNRNPLLSKNIGSDGFMTGYTEQSGYAILATAKLGNRRIFLGMSGLESSEQRSLEAQKIIDWGLNQFETVEIVPAESEIAQAEVYGGVSGTVSLKTGKATSVLMPKDRAGVFSARITYRGPLIAPIEKGTEIATLGIWNGETLSQEIPLFASSTIEAGPMTQRALNAVSEFAFGWLR